MLNKNQMMLGNFTRLFITKPNANRSKISSMKLANISTNKENKSLIKKNLSIKSISNKKTGYNKGYITARNIQSKINLSVHTSPSSVEIPRIIRGNNKIKNLYSKSKIKVLIPALRRPVRKTNSRGVSGSLTSHMNSEEYLKTNENETHSLVHKADLRKIVEKTFEILGKFKNRREYLIKSNNKLKTEIGMLKNIIFRKF